MIPENTRPFCLTIAGTDSGGGAGILADVKTFSQLKVYGSCVVTCVTAQNTQGVQVVHAESTESVMAQLKAVLSDIRIDCIKTGVLYSSDIIRSIAAELKNNQSRLLVVDPVLISASQQSLSDGSTEIIKSYLECLLPIATVITPNIEETAALTGISISTMDDVKKACIILSQSSGSIFVFLKRLQLPSVESGIVVDVVYTGSVFFEFYRPKIHKRFFGSGCTLASAIASFLAKNISKKIDASLDPAYLKSSEIMQAIYNAVEFVRVGLISSYPVGHDLVPVNHFVTINEEEGLFQKDALFVCFKNYSRSFWDNYTRSHPFLLQLAAGNLPRSSFKYYLAQDYHFLEAVHKTCSVLSSDPIFERINILFAYNVEEFHEFLSDLNVTVDDLAQIPLSNAAIDYIKFVQSHVGSKDVLSCCMSVLPCVIGYAEAAVYFMETASKTSPYLPWLYFYAGKKYQSYSSSCLDLFNDLVAERNLTNENMYTLYNVYFKAVELEIQFFNTALG